MTTSTKTLHRFLGLATTLALTAGTANATGYVGSKTDGIGNSDWAAGYTARGSVSHSSLGPAGISGDQLAAGGKLTAWARMMGTKHDILQVRGEGYSYINGARKFEAEVWAKMPWLPKVTLYYRAWDGSFSYDHDFSMVFFSVSQTVWVGPFPVTATAEATGYLGLDVDGSVGPTNIDVTVTPRAGADAFLRAGIGVPGAQVGVEGSLNLVDLQVPVTAEASMPWSGSCKVRYELDVDLRLETLSGKLSLFAQLLSDFYRHVLITWSGVHTELSLKEIAGCLLY